MASTDVVDAVADYLVAQGHTNTRAGVDWPRTPIFYQLVVEDISRAPDGFFGGTGEVRYVAVSVLIRGETSVQARTRALAVYDLLRFYSPLGMRPVGQPLPLGNVDGHPYYEVSFEAKLKE